jgi:hypothetical protein
VIDPSDQVTWSGWVGFRQQICFDLLVGGDHVAFDDEAGGWSGGFVGIKPKRMSTGLVRKSAIVTSWNFLRNVSNAKMWISKFRFEIECI